MFLSHEKTSLHCFYLNSKVSFKEDNIAQLFFKAERKDMEKQGINENIQLKKLFDKMWN